MAGAMVEWSAEGQAGQGYLATPSATPAPGVIVIQEWWGLDAHIRDVVERFAREGFLALAPDLYHGAVATEPDEARKLAMTLDANRAVAEIDAAAGYLRARPDAAGPKVGVVGFCMGGLLPLLTACRSDKVGAAVVFYGRNPDPITQVETLSCPLLGLYGEADQGIPPAEVARLEQALTTAHKDFDIHIYPGAPHAFFNDTRPSYRPEAAADAWRRTIAFFREHLGARSRG
ncbi:MAG: dienelactone hydrolase family protein [Thermomicrobiaceae bacterium]|nr:dienelactone hydrolase family protein [Thermomicrobiaceae bacterium]